MTYPIDDLTTTELDASIDDPSAARAELLAAVQKIQSMLANTGTGNEYVLKLDASGDIPTGIDIKSSLINELKGSDIASATITDIGAATGNYIDITGTTTITGLGTVQAGTRRIVQFDGILTLTHNATSLILPGAANIVTAAGDVAIFISLGSGNWTCVNYQSGLTPVYSEGTWTPIISDGTNDATNSVSNGYYTRIGRVIHFQGYLTLSSLGSVSGQLRITGLPINSTNIANTHTPIYVGLGNFLSITAGQSVTGYVQPSSDYIILRLWDSAGGTTPLLDSEINSNTVLMVAGSYIE